GQTGSETRFHTRPGSTRDPVPHATRFHTSRAGQTGSETRFHTRSGSTHPVPHAQTRNCKQDVIKPGQRPGSTRDPVSHETRFHMRPESIFRGVAILVRPGKAPNGRQQGPSNEPFCMKPSFTIGIEEEYQ